jgi:predicted DNA-binding transcriptional regulator AlpA
VKPNTLAKWRMLGTGPKFIRLSANRVAYRQSAINEWLQNRECTSTLDVPKKVPARA